MLNVQWLEETPAFLTQRGGRQVMLICGPNTITAILPCAVEKWIVVLNGGIFDRLDCDLPAIKRYMVDCMMTELGEQIVALRAVKTS
jgi:hypothetical protein